MSNYFTQSPYELIGGAGAVQRLVEAFYDNVAAHPELAPIFPGDWEETRRKQYLFMTQFLGGPPLYSEERGHPMLRARHMPFPITPRLAEAWLSCMDRALDSLELDPEVRDHIFQRLMQTAYHMVNQPPEA